MTSPSEDHPAASWTRRRYRAPRAHAQLLAAPALGEAPAQALANGRLLSGSSLELFGEPLAALRMQARQEVLEIARRRGTGFEPVPFEFGMDSRLAAAPWYVTGHQPVLFHPGVWVKNFAASSLARQSQGVGLNLIVDNDVLSSPLITVPAGDPASPTLQPVFFDRPRSPEAWEEATIHDRSTWLSFGERVDAAMSAWAIPSLAGEYWKSVVKCDCVPPAVALTQARMEWERRWGFGNVELTISEMCETASFRRFACHLLSRIDEFHDLHNTVLEEYRTLNHVRSRTHPVPDLRDDNGWREAPFWVWRRGDSGRQRLYAQVTSSGIALRAGGEILAELPLPHDLEGSLSRLEALASAGWRLRSRALTTTLFARLFLADLFIHGIGGAKYDEMTDQLLSRFYGVIPPEFLTLSGTLHLPFSGLAAPQESAAVWQSRLRDLQQHPERFVSEEARREFRPLLAERADLLTQQHRVRAAKRSGEMVPSQGSARSQRLREIRQQLLQACESQVTTLQTELKAALRRSRADAVFRNREYSFVLFPEEPLKAALTQWTGEREA